MKTWTVTIDITDIVVFLCALVTLFVFVQSNFTRELEYLKVISSAGCEVTK